MLRFLPDDWLEALLRPFLLIDPAAGLYIEFSAPDWRFAFLICFALIALWAHRGRLALTAAQVGGLFSLLVMFVVWTWVIGNGRYFVAGLLLVGPLTLMLWRALPGTQGFRVLVLAGCLSLQAYTVHLHYNDNVWGLLKWQAGPGLAIEPSPLREKPAIFLTITGISYSLLVPQFHPQSRWANVLGQQDVTPALPEYPRLRELLRSPLPKYLLVPINPKLMQGNAQPTSAMVDFLNQYLSPQGLALEGAPCAALRSPLALTVLGRPDDLLPKQGFWFCPVRVVSEGLEAIVRTSPRAEALRDVFERIETACPRFFPPNRGAPRESEGVVSRLYAASDTRLSIDSDDRVFFRYFRSMNSTLVGRVDDIRNQNFTIPCKKLPGRYQPPWADSP